jgi:hypothetical protein
MTSTNLNTFYTQAYQQALESRDKETSSKSVKSACYDFSDLLSSKAVKEINSFSLSLHPLLRIQCIEGKKLKIQSSDNSKQKEYSIGRTTKCESLMTDFFKAINKEYSKQTPLFITTFSQQSNSNSTINFYWDEPISHR